MKQKLLSGAFYFIVFLVLGFVFMLLWNNLLPSVMHVVMIGYWQALGLILLSRILFGKLSFGAWTGDKPGRNDKQYLFKNKFDDIDGSTRDAFKEEWKKRCERHARK